MQITVRTWHSVKDNSEKGYGNKMFLEKVHLPENAVLRIMQWAKEHQVNLLNRKYKRTELNFKESQSQEYLVAMNKLFKQLQEEGLNSESERLAIGFLFGQHKDNPELINLEVASRFFGEIEQERQTA
ncbi:MAG: hypothetical protein HEQ35_09520 [Gloeotrichia echinulata IR180]|jgi:hypothetical protein|nr:hypothetical protein [Gloeotrichia echinulata DEX184]